LGTAAIPMAYQKKRKYLPVYQWDIEGNLIYCHSTMEVAIENLMIKESAVRACIKRKNCYMHKWYFSRTKDFVIPKKKFAHNPLFKKDSQQRKMELQVDEYDDDDFDL
jgi:hypothetical protein